MQSPSIDDAMTSYQEVLLSIQQDRSLGSGRLCARVAQALFELAFALQHNGYDGMRAELREACRQAAQARPAMAEMIRVGNDALLSLEEGGVEGVRVWAETYLPKRIEMQQRAAAHCVQHITSPSSILTHSNSSTVYETLRQAAQRNLITDVWCTRSDPPSEGIAMAQRLLDLGVQVHLIADTAAAWAIDRVDLILFGTDALQTLGISNKVGTTQLALLGLQHSRPTHVVSTTLKCLPPSLQRLFGSEHGPPSSILSDELAHDFTTIAHTSGGALHIHNPTYERTEYGFFTSITTDQGVHDPDEISPLIRNLPVASGFGW